MGKGKKKREMERGGNAIAIVIVFSPKRSRLFIKTRKPVGVSFRHLHGQCEMTGGAGEEMKGLPNAENIGNTAKALRQKLKNGDE